MTYTTTTNATLTVTQGSNVVNITIVGQGSIKHRWDKLLAPIDVPKQATPYSIIIDLKKLRETVTAVGYLEDESVNTMWTKRHTLRTIMQTAGTIYFKWDSNDPDQWRDASDNVTGVVGSGTWLGYRGDILVCDINENAEGIGNSDDAKSMSITIQFIVGVLKP